MCSILISLMSAVRASFRTRLVLQTEILALRHQIIVLRRSVSTRPKIRAWDRSLWIWLSRLWPVVRQNSIRIETVDFPRFSARDFPAMVFHDSSLNPADFCCSSGPPGISVREIHPSTATRRLEPLTATTCESCAKLIAAEVSARRAEHWK